MESWNLFVCLTHPQLSSNIFSYLENEAIFINILSVSFSLLLHFYVVYNVRKSSDSLQKNKSIHLCVL